MEFETKTKKTLKLRIDTIKCASSELIYDLNIKKRTRNEKKKLEQDWRN